MEIKPTLPLEYLVEEYLQRVHVKMELVQELNLAVLNISCPCKKKYVYSELNLYYPYGLVHQMVLLCLVQLKSEVSFTSYTIEISVYSKHVMIYEIMCFC